MDQAITIYLIPIAVILLGILGMRYHKKWSITHVIKGFHVYNRTEIKTEEKKAELTSAENKSAGGVDAIVYDLNPRTFGPERISAEDVAKIRETHKNLGRIVQDSDDGKDYYSLYRDGDKLTPVSIPQTLKYPPDMLYIPFLVKYPVALVFDVKVEKSLLQKWGHVILVACLSLAVVFLLVADK